LGINGGRITHLIFYILNSAPILPRKRPHTKLGKDQTPETKTLKARKRKATASPNHAPNPKKPKPESYEETMIVNGKRKMIAYPAQNPKTKRLKSTKPTEAQPPPPPASRKRQSRRIINQKTKNSCPTDVP
jgi:hypothetical protein